jgi:hypothetical protein
MFVLALFEPLHWCTAAVYTDSLLTCSVLVCLQATTTCSSRTSHARTTTSYAALHSNHRACTQPKLLLTRIVRSCFQRYDLQKSLRVCLDLNTQPQHTTKAPRSFRCPAHMLPAICLVVAHLFVGLQVLAGTSRPRSCTKSLCTRLSRYALNSNLEHPRLWSGCWSEPAKSTQHWKTELGRTGRQGSHSLPGQT